MSESKPKEGRGVGEAPEYLPDGSPNLSGIARQERADKAAAAAEAHARLKQIEAETIAREGGGMER